MGFAAWSLGFRTSERKKYTQMLRLWLPASQISRKTKEGAFGQQCGGHPGTAN